MSDSDAAPLTAEQGLLLRVPVNEPPLVVIHPNGTVTLREGLTLDDASRAFWEHVGGENAALRDRLARAEEALREIRALAISTAVSERIRHGHFEMGKIADAALLAAPTDGAVREGAR